MLGTNFTNLVVLTAKQSADLLRTLADIGGAEVVSCAPVKTQTAKTTRLSIDPRAEQAVSISIPPPAPVISVPLTEPILIIRGESQ